MWRIPGGYSFMASSVKRWEPQLRLWLMSCYDWHRQREKVSPLRGILNKTRCPMPLNSVQSKARDQLQNSGGQCKIWRSLFKNWEFQDGNNRPFNQVLNPPDYKALCSCTGHLSRGLPCHKSARQQKPPVWNQYARNRVGAWISLLR